MAKLSQQAQSQTPQVLTRTERVMQKQSVQRFQREKADFEARKKQAEEIRQTKFSEVQSVEDYKKKYETIDPKLKEFFLTPTEVEKHQVTELENTKTRITERLIEAQEKKTEVTKRYEDKIKKAEESWYNKSSKYRHDENKKERYKKKLNDYEDTQEEKEIYWEWYIRKIQEGQSQLNAGKNISYNDLDNFASNYGSYKQDKKEASNEGRAYKREQKQKIEDLKQAGYKPHVIEKSFKGKPTSTELTFYHPGTKDWQKVAEFKTKDSYDISGLKKLGYSAPQTRTISYGGKDFKFKSRVPLFVTPKTKDIVTPYGETGFKFNDIPIKTELVETEHVPVKSTIDTSTKFLIDRGVPSVIAKTGGKIAKFGMSAYDIVKQVDSDVSTKLQSIEDRHEKDGGLSGLDIKPIGYSRWTDERKKNWDKYIKETEEAQKKDSETYIPTTIRTGSGRLWTETKERPLLTTGVITGAVTMAPITTVAGVTSMVTGADIMVSDFGKKISEQAEETKQEEKIRGNIAEVVGGSIQGIGWLMPKTSTEVLIDATAVKYLPKVYKKYPIFSGAGLTSFGAYNIYSGVTTPTATTGERYGKVMMGGGALLGASAGFITTYRKVSTYGSKDYIKSGKTELGIGETKIDVTSKAIQENRDLSLNELSFIGATKRQYGDLDIQFIPSRKDKYVKDLDTLQLLRSDIAYRDKPKMPKTTEIQSQILDVVKSEKGIVSGSFAQQVLVKQSRDFKDLDILTKYPKKLAQQMRTQLGDKVDIKVATITDSPLGKFDIYKVYEKTTGKHLADIDPIKFSEEGFGKMMGSLEVDGLKLLPPEVRYTSKVIQSTRPLPTEKRIKVITDISQLSGKPELLTSSSLLRGYGLSKAEQKTAYLGGDIIGTHGGMGIIPIFSEKIKVTGKPGDVFYMTPSELKKGVAFSRLSRMGVDADVRGISMLELLNPKTWKSLNIFPKRKDVIIETGKLGKDFMQPNLQTSEIEIGREIGKEGFFEYDIVKKYKTVFRGDPINIAIVEKAKVEPKEITKSIPNILNKAFNDAHIINIATQRKPIESQILISPIRTKIYEKSDIITEQEKDFFKLDIQPDKLKESYTLPIKTQPVLSRLPKISSRDDVIKIRTSPTERQIISTARKSIPIRKKDVTYPREDITRVIKNIERLTKRPRDSRRKIRDIVRIDTPPMRRPKRPRDEIDKVKIIDASLKQKVQQSLKKFSVFGRRFNEDVLLTTTHDQSIAEKKLKTFLKKTLGRSGQIKQNGEVLLFQQMKSFDDKFRPAKKDKGRIVQKAKYSLGSGTEVSEIQFFKRQKEGIRKKVDKNKLVNKILKMSSIKTKIQPRRRNLKLNPEIISGEQAQSKIKKILTGGLM